MIKDGIEVWIVFKMLVILFINNCIKINQMYWTNSVKFERLFILEERDVYLAI